MQKPIDPAEEDFAAELRQFQPLPPCTSKSDLWYAAGFAASQRRARRWHVAALVAVVGSASFVLIRPKPHAVTRIVDRVVYVDRPTDPIAQPPLASASKNHRLMGDVLQDRWVVSSPSGNAADRTPIIGAWMTDPDSKTLGELR